MPQGPISIQYFPQLSAASLVVIAIIMAVGCIQGRPVLDMFNVGVSLAVAAIPEVGRVARW